MDVIEIEPNIVELDELNFPELKLNIESEDINNFEQVMPSRPSVNFGTGIELLMNDKSRDSKKTSSNIEIDDIAKLEDELNDLTIDSNEIKQSESNTTKKTIFGGLFGNKEDGSNIKSVNETEAAKKQSNLGKSTSDINENRCL